MQYVKVDWLNAASSTGPTDVEQVQGAARYAIICTATGSPDQVNVSLQGSLDGANWFTLVGANEGVLDQFLWSDSTPGNSDVPYYKTKGPVSYIRLNLTNLYGGTSPTVTASAIATD